MITVEQSRAARGLLGWTQQNLADAAGLSKTAINNFEKKNSDIKTDSLRAVRMAFEAMGIEFLSGDGVRRRKDRSQILKGADSLKTLVGDILYSAVRKGHAALYVMNARADHAEDLNRLAGAGVQVRVLHAADVTMPDGAGYMSGRLPDSHADMVGHTTFLYGSVCAFLLSGTQDVILIHSDEIASAEKKRFEVLWALHGSETFLSETETEEKAGQGRA